MRADNSIKILGHRLRLGLALGAMAVNVLTPIAAVEAQTSGPSNSRTPIKHLIVVVGENHSFDNVFATYVPPDPTQSVWNLLSQGIIDKTGAPGTNAAKALQRQATAPLIYQIAPSITGPFSALPQPSTTLNALPASPCGMSKLLTLFGENPSGVSFCSDIGLLPADQPLLSAGGTGQPLYFPKSPFDLYPVPDCRYPSSLPNAPYSLVGASQLDGCKDPLFPPPYYKSKAITPTVFSDNVGDPVHRFFNMWQQNDCSAASFSTQNPSGCLHDLYTWVATSVGWQITQDGKPPTNNQGTFQGGIEMGVYNMAAGDYPYFQSLAQNFTISDNYHQPIMGGTGPNSQFLMTGDVYYYTDSNGNAVAAPTDLIENPNPQLGSNNFYTHASPGVVDAGNTSSGGLVNCSNPLQPGVLAIQYYLGTLPYRPFNNGNCASGHFYQIDNEYPYYDHLGGVIQQGNEFTAGPAFAIGPQTIPTIGDSLSAANISWKYYGEGFSQAADPLLASQLYCAICNGFQFSRSIMTGPLKANLQDLPAFFTDVTAGTLPAVSFIKPDLLLDSHPGTSTPPLFEGFVQNIIQAVQQNLSLWQNTAIMITFDESGGSYDSGYIQPIDFFGDGPRTVLITVSPFAKTGFIDHTYADHASILKFIERNWGLKPLSTRSRDNLPNPIVLAEAPYFPRNSPAIGDLMEMFQLLVDTHDFNGDGKSDIAWRDTSGNTAIWLMNGATVLSSGLIGTVPATWSIVGQRDFNGDGKADLLWRDTSGNTSIWFMNGTQIASSAAIGNVPTSWAVVGTGDFNGDGDGDLLWRDSSGNLAVWLMNGATVTSSAGLGNLPTTWAVVGTGDFNGDGKTDILWRDNLGNTAMWFMNGTTVISAANVGNVPNWSVVGTGDFNGDGVADIAWQDTLGNTAIWLMNGAAVVSSGSLGLVPPTTTLALTGDFNGDGMSDLLWRDTLGNTAIWFMNGITVASTGAVGNIPTTWTVQSVNAE
jgi:phospholipase C